MAQMMVVITSMAKKNWRTPINSANSFPSFLSFTAFERYAIINGALPARETHPNAQRTPITTGDTKIIMTTGVNINRKKMTIAIPPMI